MEQVTIERAPSSRRPAQRRPLQPTTRQRTAKAAQSNVGVIERWLSAAVGSALLVSSIRRPSPGMAAMVFAGGGLLHRGVTGHCYVYQAIGRNTADAQQSRNTRGERVERSITIGKPVAELYRAWRDPEHVRAMLRSFAQIEPGAQGQFRWRVELPMGRALEWTTRTIEDRPNELIRWSTEAGAPITHEGSVRFRPAPHDLGTVVTLSFSFGQPGGVLDALTAKFLRSIPKALEEGVLRRCKSLCETGEIPTLDKNPSARESARKTTSDRKSVV